MKNTAIILLSVLLAVTVISEVILYRNYIDTKDEFLTNKEKLSGLNEEIIQLKKINAELSDQVLENINNSNELKIAKTRISELEDTINTKNNSISDLEEKLRSLESDFQEKVKDVENLEAEISSKNSIVTELQERFKSSLSRISERENMIIEYKNELEVFQDRISKLQKKNLESEAHAQGIKTGYETTIFDLNQEIQSRDETIAGLKKRYENLLLRIPEIQGEKEQLKSNIDQLQSTYDAIASELTNQIRNKEVTISELQDKFSITFVDRVLFKLGKATITPEGGEILTKVGKNLRSVHNRRIRVIGHTDNIPIMDAYRYKFPSNWELSAARAAAVVRHFQKEIGLNPQSLEAVGRSFYEPITSNESEEGRAKNRRVEIIIAPLIE